MKIKNQLFEKMMDRHILELQRVPMPVKISYYLKNIMVMLGKESKPFFERKKEIVGRHQNGDKIPPENTAAFLKEMNEIYNEEVELDIQKLNIRIDDLPDLSIMQIDFIEPFFNIQG